MVRGAHCCLTPEPTATLWRRMLLLLCLLFGRSWLTAEGDRHVGAASVLHRRDGRAAVALVGRSWLVAFQRGRPRRAARLCCMAWRSGPRRRTPATVPIRPSRKSRERRQGRLLGRESGSALRLLECADRAAGKRLIECRSPCQRQQSRRRRRAECSSCSAATVCRSSGRVALPRFPGVSVESCLRQQNGPPPVWTTRLGCCC